MPKKLTPNAELAKAIILQSNVRVESWNMYQILRRIACEGYDVTDKIEIEELLERVEK